jgi:uncharacterized protein
MNTLNKLSKGCQLCLKGKWLCIFLTYQCNARCHFCHAPFKDDRIHSAFGSTKEEILSYLNKSDFEGISFSGGDPFVVFNRLMEWLIYFRKHFPDYYYWVYTNGIDVNYRKMELLAAAGMNEIRFNIAATGYLSEKIWGCIESARELFPYVTVEIPSINEDYRLLEAALSKLEKTGVDYLNLHDYILSESDLRSQNEQYGIFVLNKIIKIRYALSSVNRTKNILNSAHENSYHFQINHCSLEQKELQMTMRRIQMGKVFNNPEYDFLMTDGTICNYHTTPDGVKIEDIQEQLQNLEFSSLLNKHKIKLTELNEKQSTGLKIIKISYVPKMGIGQEKTFIECSII